MVFRAQCALLRLYKKLDSIVPRSPDDWSCWWIWWSPGRLQQARWAPLGPAVRIPCSVAQGAGLPSADKQVQLELSSRCTVCICPEHSLESLVFVRPRFGRLHLHLLHCCTSSIRDGENDRNVRKGRAFTRLRCYARTYQLLVRVPWWAISLPPGEHALVLYVSRRQRAATASLRVYSRVHISFSVMHLDCRWSCRPPRGKIDLFHTEAERVKPPWLQVPHERMFGESACITRTRACFRPTCPATRTALVCSRDGFHPFGRLLLFSHPRSIQHRPERQNRHARPTRNAPGTSDCG